MIGRTASVGASLRNPVPGSGAEPPPVSGRAGGRCMRAPRRRCGLGREGSSARQRAGAGPAGDRGGAKASVALGGERDAVRLGRQPGNGKWGEGRYRSPPASPAAVPTPAPGARGGSRPLSTPARSPQARVPPPARSPRLQLALPLSAEAAPCVPLVSRLSPAGPFVPPRSRPAPRDVLRLPGLRGSREGLGMPGGRAAQDPPGQGLKGFDLLILGVGRILLSPGSKPAAFFLVCGQGSGSLGPG